MTSLEAVSILLERAPEENVMEYVAKKLKARDNYFDKFNKDKLISDFLIS